MARNWKATLRPASYRGVPFWVEAEEISGGRRVAVHEVLGDKPALLEDMGARTQEIGVTAYLVGDFSDFASSALAAACSAPGPGLLVLPPSIALTVHVTAFTRSRERDRQGYFAFSLSAVSARRPNGLLFSAGGVLAAVLSGGSRVARGFSRLVS